jgi:hypothetical protein
MTQDDTEFPDATPEEPDPPDGERRPNAELEALRRFFRIGATDGRKR